MASARRRGYLTLNKNYYKTASFKLLLIINLILSRVYKHTFAAIKSM